MFATSELSEGIPPISYWFHIALHLALATWYFAVKYRIGRAKPSSIVRMCIPAFWLSLVQGAIIATNGSLSWVQGIVGITINAGLMLLFAWRYAEARGETQR